MENTKMDSETKSGCYAAAFAIVVLIVAAIIGVGWNLAHGRFIAPIEEENRRLTVEQSKAFRDGTVQELQNMQFEYVKATPSQQEALASIILHRASTIPADMEIPAGLAGFLAELKAKKVKQ